MPLFSKIYLQFSHKYIKILPMRENSASDMNVAVFQYLPHYFVKTTVFIFLFCCKPFVHTQENRWYEPFFIEGSAIHYYLPDLFSGIIKPEPGVRAAFGYEYRHFRFAAESGYTHITGTNPMVLDITLIPLTAKAGYNLPLRWGFGLQADLSCGVFFSHTVYYSSAIDMLMDKIQDKQVISPLAGARLYATYTFLSGFIKLYAGGGVDIVFETDGLIPPPVIEAGVSIKPLSLIKRSAKQPVNAVYFQRNSTAMIEEYSGTLDEAGLRLRENPSLRLTMRAYTPPPGDAEWQVQREDGTPALSAARAGYCVQYLQERYGINSSRIKIEYRNAGKASDDAQRELFRCVELIIR
jgi:hypothetical protein